MVKNDVISVMSSLESMYIADTEFKKVLLNLNFPVPGSEFTVDESNV